MGFEEKWGYFSLNPNFSTLMQADRQSGGFPL
jgi:hypothetical protein